MVAAVALLGSCHGLPAGPSLSNISVSPLSLQPTAGDRALCCCRVVGTTRNLNSVAVHATFKFSAFDGVNASPISRILFFVSDLRPGVERPIDAHGFVYPCNIIKELRTELDIRGIALPPL
jgi:hypothetical protein